MTEEEAGVAKGGRPRNVQAQQAIIAATFALLATEGFDGMSIEAIAARAGVGKKTIYRWWDSKEALVIDVIKSLHQTQAPVIDTGSLRADLIAMLSNASQVVNGPDIKGLVVSLLGVMINHPEIYQAFYDQAIAPRFQVVVQMIQQAQARGEVRQDIDANEIIGLLAGPIWNHMLFGTRNIPLAPDLPEKIVDMVLQGIVG
jgi:AcrR family transcriptional regulator